MLQPIKFDNGKLWILDQLQLPRSFQYLEISGVQEGYDAIKTMKVRGAPAIGIVAALSLAIELKRHEFHSKDDLHDFIVAQMRFLSSSRPTAINLVKVSSYVAGYSESLQNKANIDVMQMRDSVIADMGKLLDADIAINKAIGEYGGKHISSTCENPIILTHCNTGSLATAGYGTALGVIRWLHEQGKLQRAFFTETRPYNQGARLTSYELMHDNIPCTMICDNAAAASMKNKLISAVVVGADRVVKNGDTANKIGTYQLAICAKHHNIPFYVACPRSSLDFTLENGYMIPIEERDPDEMRFINTVLTSCPNVPCWNPQFDVTPAELITGGIVTECGVYPASSLMEHEELLSAMYM